MLVLVAASCAPAGTEVNNTTGTTTTETTAETTTTETVATTPPAAATTAEENKPMSAYVKNFLDLAGKGFYDGTLFHRVIAGFMIQGGDPNTKGGGNPAAWGTGGSGEYVKAEFNTVSHKR